MQVCAVGRFYVSGDCLWINRPNSLRPLIGALSLPVTKNRNAFFYSRVISWRISHKYLIIGQCSVNPSYSVPFCKATKSKFSSPQIIFCSSSGKNVLIIVPVTTR